MHHRRAATALEFALILPVFVMLVAGIMDVAWLFYSQTALDRATVLGCRAAALLDPGEKDANLAAVKRVAETQMKASLVASAVGVTMQPDSLLTAVTTHGTPPGRSLVCKVSVDVDPLLGLEIGNLTLHSALAVRLEWQRSPP